VQARHHASTAKACADLRHAAQAALLRASVLAQGFVGMEAQMRGFPNQTRHQGEHMTDDDLLDAKRFLMDLHFIQANAIVAAQLQEDKKAIAYMKRIAQVRDAIEAKLKDKNT